MLKKTFRNLLYQIPPVRRYVDQVRQTRASAEDLEKEIARLNEIINHSRSPALFQSKDDLLTERLLAHPAIIPLPEVSISSSPAIDNSNREIVAERLLDAYHKSLEDEHKSSLRREGEDVWTELIRNELPDLMAMVENRKAKELADYLMNFGQSFVWFGGITTCLDGYNKNLDPKQVALTYLDKLICFSESIGLSRFESPEHGPWGNNLHENLAELVDEIEKHLGISIAPPLGIIHTDGLQINENLFHYRHINGLYCGTRIADLRTDHGKVCEFGGGLGITAMYARRLGVTDYTMLDLPITCLLAGHYLLHAVGLDSVALYGETMREDVIKILPFWECLNLPDKSYSLTINQDSFPELAENLITEYLNQIKRITTDRFLSINHESFYPKTVANFIKQNSGYQRLYRGKYWVREGYLEEVYDISNGNEKV
ncbi:putative sugar O-methyltransferase [Gimesia sp.]|uniref:putative sugar O-methyltransferase n=1 Tax=Gimesia sp. TaxID=2024833 RepID=UPI003A903C91